MKPLAFFVGLLLAASPWPAREAERRHLLKLVAEDFGPVPGCHGEEFGGRPHGLAKSSWPA